MTREFLNLEVKIVPRISWEKHPFSELLFTWLENGIQRFSCSRVWWVVSDTPHGRGSEIAAFRRRHAV